jgi:lipoprotein-releasing system permease protein
LERTARAVEFQVVGIFQTGFPDFDSRWAYTSLKAAQQLAPDTTGQSNDRASAIEFRLDDLNRAEEVGHQAEAIAGPQFTAVPWMAANRPVFQALKLEKLGTLIVIGLIVFVAAMNVLTMLTMLVIEKRKEIAVLLSMGTKRKQIRRLFVYQGIVIDLVGTALGLLLGYSLAWGANTFHWVKVPPEVYAVDYIPFHAHVIDGVLVAALALVVSLAATAYPARRAVAIVPAETLRYE